MRIYPYTGSVHSQTIIVFAVYQTQSTHKQSTTRYVLWPLFDEDTLDHERMGAGTGGAGWASAHPGKNQGGHGPPWKF